MSKVSFDHAFDRWYKLTETEVKTLKAEKARAGVVLSWEALDHLCGLAVESGMKALMLKEKLVSAEDNGDYPKNEAGRRPHVDELWNIFMTKAQGRKHSEWVRRLSGKQSEPVSIFQTWRTEHRYAENGTVSETLVQNRFTFAQRLKRIAQEEGF
jgi:hypothetical protein